MKDADRPGEGEDFGSGTRVIMLLSNPFEFDSRVMKEARSAAGVGFSVTVLATPKAGLPRQQDGHGFTVRRLGRQWRISRTMRLQRLLWYCRCLVYCVHNRPQIIHVHDRGPLAVGWFAARLTGAGLVYDSHELWSRGLAISRKPRLVQEYLRRQERFFAARTDANFQADRGRAEYFAKEFRLSPPRTLSNCPTYQISERNDRLRRAAGLGECERIIVYSGIIGPGRGTDAAMRAVELLPGHVHLVFLSYGRTDWVTRFQRSSSAGSRVHIVPPVPYDEVVSMVAGADVGLSLIQNTNLSYYLGAPNKLFEYMMAGVPVVGSTFPGIESVIRDADFGLVVDPENPHEIAASVTRILSDENLNARFRSNALRAARKYCWENQVPELLSVYRNLAVRPREKSRELSTAR